MSKLWFKAKTYGWGWTPSSIEGWIVTLLFLILTIINSSGIMQLSLYDHIPHLLDFAFFYGFQAVLIGSLLLICMLKGEKPSWRWGEKTKKKSKQLHP